MDWYFYETRECPKCEEEYDAFTKGEYLPFALQIRGGPLGKNWKHSFSSAHPLFGTINTSACPKCVPDQAFLRYFYSTV